MRPEEKKLWDALLDGQLDMETLREPLMDHYSPEFIRAVQDLRDLSADLDRDGKIMEEVLAEAQAAAVTDEDRALLEHMPPHAGSVAGGTTQPAWGRRVAPWVAVAASLLVAFTAYRFSRPPQEEPGPQLGGPEAIQATHPIGGGADFREFRWSASSRLGAWYVVHVTDEQSGQTWTSEKLSESTWTPDPPIAAQRIRWHVEAYDPSTGEPTSSSSVSASR